MRNPRLLVPIATLVLAVTLTACGSDEPAPSSPPPAEPTTAEPEFAPEPTQQEIARERVQVHSGDTVKMTLPPSGLTDIETPSQVSMTFGMGRVQPSSLTKGNVFVTIDAEVKNTGDGPADLRALTWSWQGKDGLFETAIGVMCDDELESDLPPGARTEGCFMVDVPKQPGTLTLEAMDKAVTIELTADLINS